MNEQTAPTKGGSGQSQKVLIGLLVVLIVAVLAVGGLLLHRMNQPPQTVLPELGTGNVVVDDTFDPQEMQRKVDENMFEVKMNTTWNFPNGSQQPSSDAYVANSNANRLPFYFTLTLDTDGDGTDEVLYTSPKVPVGSAVRAFPLAVQLEPGMYTCVCTYTLLNADDTVDSNVSVTARLHVK